ncbi:MAG: PKD domain-containing protein [Bacteroidota bacterium]
MRKIYILFLLILPFYLSSQVYTGSQASDYINGATEVRMSDRYSAPKYIEFSKGNEIPVSDFNLWASKMLNLAEGYSFNETKRHEDKLGYEHIRLQVNYNNIPLIDGIVILHTKNGMIESINGNFPRNIQIKNSFSLSESEGRNKAINFVDADSYKWEIPKEEEFIKQYTGNPEASFYPEAGQSIVPVEEQGETAFAYAYKYDIYAHDPVYRADIYVDASTGKILMENKTIHHADSSGSANTKYSGTRNITADYHNNQFRLREDGRGNGIETFDMNNSTTYGNAVDFTDSDNYWNNYNADYDEVAGDAHWAAEKTYDYYLSKHNRNSIDNNGLTITSYLHYDVDYANAFWNGQFMTYGDGNGSNVTPLTAIDIVAHEITHGVTSHTADLIYQDESGALNEGFSDIFASAVEAYARPNNHNWDIGEDIGVTLRSMANPNNYQLPDTYHGNHWYFGSDDNGGVHTNMGPFSYWYYLLVEGGSGTNDNNDNYSVNAIGMDTASAIAYRMLNTYLTPSSEYSDARYYAIKAATDLYGACSQPVISVTDAMHAIGVGDEFIPGVQADFAADLTSFCQPPATVNFTNESNNGMDFYWDFGDGDTSSAMNPSHTYSQFGDYNVKLIADGGSCGIDSIIDTAFISVDTSNMCQNITPQSGSITLNQCDGILYDDGGPGDNYSDNSNSSVTIDPIGASTIDIQFTSFHFESGYDYLNIYDGTSTSDSLIGSYDGSSLPNNGNPISSTGGAVTIEQETDQYVNESGFALEWNCHYPNTAPTVDFTVSDTISCEKEVQFNDRSSNGPSSWTWDFGDGTTSNQQNPLHVYTQDGTYDVKLKVSNAYGSDSLILNSFVTVKTPDSITGDTMHHCNNNTISLQQNPGSGTVHWYADANHNNLIDTGNTLPLPTLTNDTTIFAVNKVMKPSVFGAKQDNSGGGDYFDSPYEHALVFDVYEDITLKSVKVYASSSGNREIKLLDNYDNVVTSKTINIPQGEHRIDLNFNIPAGTDYKLFGPESPDLFRNNYSLSYPFDIKDLVSIKHSTASSDPTSYYYYFYDWEIESKTCSSPEATFNIYTYTDAPVADFDYQKNTSEVSFTNMSTKSKAYFWDFDDGNTSTMENPTHTYNQTGTYDVMLKTDNPCGTDSIEKSVVITETGIDEQYEEDIVIYPNPASDKISIELNTNHLQSVELFTFDGKLLKEKSHSFDKKDIVQFNLQNLSSGIYYLKINLNERVIRKKLIII